MNIFLLIIALGFYFVSTLIVETIKYILKTETNKIYKYIGTIFAIIKFLSLIFIGFYLNAITLTFVLIMFSSKIISSERYLIENTSKWLIKFINKPTEIKDRRV